MAIHESITDARAIEISQRLTRISVQGAHLILALMVLDTWGNWQGLSVLLATQVLIMPFNIWINVRALPRLGVRRAELLRAAVNMSSMPIIMHYAGWPLPVWLYLPFVAMCFDHLGKREHWTLLTVLSLVMGTGAWLDGVPLIVPLSACTFSIFCAQLSSIRVNAVRDMLAESDRQRCQLTRAHDEVRRAHEELQREATAREQTELVARDLARQAGRAEMAAGVLHNIGNALNGFTVVTALLDRQVKASRVNRLRDALRLLGELETKERGAAPCERGPMLVTYLEKLVDHLETERDAVVGHVQQLQDTTQHIVAVIAKQQAYAKPCSISEPCLPADLVRDAVALTHSSRRRGAIDLEDGSDCTSQVTVDRHRVLQIIMNLIRNAEEAVTSSSAVAPSIKVSTRCEQGRLKISVSDNGIGVSPENMKRLFQYGFTTKESGHGFGLHNSKLVADELHGTLSCTSEGEGRGATFTLELPTTVQPAAAA